MQIKSVGNVPDTPPLLKKNTNGCRLPKKYWYEPPPPPLEKQLDILCPIVSAGRSMRPSVKYFDDYNVSGHTQAQD